MALPVPRWLTLEVRQAKRGEGAAAVAHTSGLLERLRLPTVCDSARCPNRGECFSHHTATFLILRRVLKPRLIAVFAGVVALGILIVGYLFNLLPLAQMVGAGLK